MSELRRPRRYYLLKARAADDRCEEASADMWRGKQQAQPGSALPATFPVLEKLSCAGYTTVEDIDGADECELVDAGLTRTEAEVVLAELAALIA